VEEHKQKKKMKKTNEAMIFVYLAPLIRCGGYEKFIDPNRLF
jgi:hypothetical protein